LSARNQGGSSPDDGGVYYTKDDVARAAVRAIAPLLRGKVVWEPHAGGGSFVRALLELDVASEVLATDLDPMAPALHPPPVFVGRYRHACRNFLLTVPGNPWPAGTPRSGVPGVRNAQVEAWPAGWPLPDVILGNPPYSIRLPKLGPDGEQLRYPASHKRAGQLRWDVIEVATDHVLHGLQCVPVGGFVAYTLRIGFLGGKDHVRRLHGLTPPARVDTYVPRPSFTGQGTDNSEYAQFVWEHGREPGPFSGNWIRW
jgi:hypothetical protein